MYINVILIHCFPSAPAFVIGFAWGSYTPYLIELEGMYL